MELEMVLAGIAKHRERIHSNGVWADPHELSDISLKLSTYNSYLADHLAPLHRAATDKAYAVYLEATANGEGVTKADLMSRGESTEERERYERIKFIYSATEKLMSQIQTKIKVVENQLSREGKM